MAPFPPLWLPHLVAIALALVWGSRRAMTGVGHEGRFPPTGLSASYSIAAVAEVILDRPRVARVVGELAAAAVPQHQPREDGGGDPADGWGPPSRVAAGQSRRSSGRPPYTCRRPAARLRLRRHRSRSVPMPRWSCGCNGSHRAHHLELRLPRPWRDGACRGGSVRESAPVRIRQSCPETAASVDLRANWNAAPSERSSRLRDGQTLRSAGLDRHIFCSSGRVNGSGPPECNPRQRDRAVAPVLAAKDWRR